MTLKSNAKFEEKLTLGSKNDMTNLEKICTLHFNVLFLSIAYKVSATKVQKNYLFRLKNDMRNLVKFNPSSGKSEKLHFDGLLL